MHRFCRMCLVEWSKRSNQCPVCRTPYSQIMFNIKSDSQYEMIPVEPPRRQFRYPFLMADGTELDFESIHRFLQSVPFRPMRGPPLPGQPFNPNQAPNMSMNGFEITMVRETRDLDGNVVRMNRVFFIPEERLTDLGNRNSNPNPERAITPMPFDFPVARSFLTPSMNAAEGPTVRPGRNRQLTSAVETNPNERTSVEGPHLAFLDPFPVEDEFGQMFRSFQEWFSNRDRAQANVESVLSQSPMDRPQSSPESNPEQSTSDQRPSGAMASRRKRFGAMPKK